MFNELIALGIGFINILICDRQIAESMMYYYYYYGWIVKNIYKLNEKRIDSKSHNCFHFAIPKRKRNET